MSVDELKDGMRIKHPAWEEIWVVRMVGSDFRLVCDEIGILKTSHKIMKSEENHLQNFIF